MMPMDDSSLTVTLEAGEPIIMELDGDFLARVPILWNGEEIGHVIVAAGDEDVEFSHA